MSEFVEKSIKEIRKAENRRVGDVFDECQRRGCDKSFLYAFETRIINYPIIQTESFLEYLDGEDEDLLRQWKIYLEVLIEKRPENEKYEEWKKALKLLQ